MIATAKGTTRSAEIDRLFVCVTVDISDLRWPG
jgi:hypothetical protein